MGYTPTDWKDDDEVTSSKLNNLESGVTAVGYTPTTWASGDTVTAEKLNKLEQGVADCNDLVSYADRTITEFTFTEDMRLSSNNHLSIGNFYALSFAGCAALSKINGSEYVDSFIGGSAFNATQALKRIDFPNATKLGDSNANNSIMGGSGVVVASFGSVTELYNGSLAGANDLEYLYLPSVKTIGASIQGDQKLKHVYIGATCTTINSGAFGGSGGQSTGLIIDCGFAQGAVSGAPWGATNATINYGVTDPGSVDAMIEADEGGNS